MSKPNLLAFSSSVGIYRNKRMWDLKRLLSKSIHRKVEFAAMSPMLFQAVMAYAAENQIDGNFHGYTMTDWTEIFGFNGIELNPSEASAIIQGFREVGLFDDDKIRSWMKYNRHLADYEGIPRAKRQAGKLSAKRRQQEAKAAVKTGHVDLSKNGENPAPKPVQKPPQKDSPTKLLWVLDQALLTARGQAKRDLLKQREQLLSESTGVDLSTPSPSPAPPPAKPPRKLSAADRERDLLTMAQATLKDCPDALSENMVKALVQAGYRLPADVQSRFRKLLKESDNPVPE